MSDHPHDWSPEDSVNSILKRLESLLGPFRRTGRQTYAFEGVTVLIRTSKRHSRGPGVADYWFGVQDRAFRQYPHAFLILGREGCPSVVVPMSEVATYRDRLSKDQAGNRKLNIVVEGGQTSLAVKGNRIDFGHFLDGFHLLNRGVPGPVEIQEPKSAVPERSAEQEQAQLSLERDLEEYMSQNLESVEPGLRLYADQQVKGRQLRTEAGIIDILAKDLKGDLVVIELKAGVAPDRTLSQLLAYMQWVRRSLAQGKPVRGVIVAADYDARLEMAAREVPAVKLLRYRVRFEVEAI